MPKPLPYLPPHAILTKRHLPHLDLPGHPTFVTFRLYDTLPPSVRKAILEQVEQWRKAYSTSEAVAHKRLIAFMDRYLDDAAASGSGPCHLQSEVCCEIFLKHLLRGVENKRYLVHAYCVMPNHVHLLLETRAKTVVEDRELSWEGAIRRRGIVDAQSEKRETSSGRVPYWSLAKVLQGLKSYSAREINEYLGRSGSFWQDESFDHVVRDQGEYGRIISYIEDNPVKAGLCTAAGHWQFSSVTRPAK